MAAAIFLEGVELQNAAQRMGSIVKIMENIKNNILNTNDKTTTFWTGKASAQNDQNYRKLCAITDSYLANAMKTKVALDEAVAMYTEAERSQVKKVLQLGTKGIFSADPIVYIPEYPKR